MMILKHLPSTRRMGHPRCQILPRATWLGSIAPVAHTKEGPILEREELGCEAGDLGLRA